MCCSYQIVNVCVYFTTLGVTGRVTGKIVVVVWGFFFSLFFFLILTSQLFLESLYVGSIHGAHAVSEQEFRTFFSLWCPLWAVCIPCMALT